MEVPYYTMVMRKLALIALALVALPVGVSAQQVEYVTRGSVGNHAIRFGSSPLRSTLPRAYVRVNNAPHAIGTGARPLDSRQFNRRLPPIRVVRIHGTDQVIATVAEHQRSDRHSHTALRSHQRVRVVHPKPPAPSRHALTVHAMLKSRLHVHR